MDKIKQNMQDIIDEILELIASAKKIPLSNNMCSINRDEIEKLLYDLDDAMPVEIENARTIARDRDNILMEAEEKASMIIKGAEEKANQLVSRSEIVRRAREQADDIVTKAQAHANQIKSASSEYVIEMITKTENVLTKIHNDLRDTKSEFRNQIATKRRNK